MSISEDTRIQLNGDTWRVISVGASRDQKTYCHLASTTRFRQQRNGKVPLQMCDWIDDAALDEARKQSHITDFYSSRTGRSVAPFRR